MPVLALAACVAVPPVVHADPSDNPASDQRPEENAEAHDSGRLDWTADFRLRYEANSRLGEAPGYDRGVIRGRAGADYAINDRIVVSARLVTGDPDNPRTADVEIGDFASDLDISLDRLFARYEHAGARVQGGKFPNPFRTTELVWDGDVNPQGLSGQYALAAGDSFHLQVAGLYFAIDDALSPTRSDMLGGQVGIDWIPGAHWKVSLALAYYDYDIPKIEPGLPGGARGNAVATDGVTYLSDFNLVEQTVSATYLGFGDQWPLQVSADYVVNRGAAVPGDTGYELSVDAGHLDRPGAMKVRYAYSQAETDAVLGLFSNDNIPLPTNYRLHALSFDYALVERVYLGLTHYHFRQKDVVDPSTSLGDWADRTRLNLYFIF